ncbi:MAG: hypothetical protein AM1032_000164 [Mycoplasmataceae bacterium]|nr:MAG: hypothetical protein AM1032_000164 [Mycoplasmataceae bacterium]
MNFINNKKNETNFIILESIDIYPLISVRNALVENLMINYICAIQAYEACYETTWKILKSILILDVLNKIESMNFADIFFLAYQKGLISDHKSWINYHNKRNITSREYQEEIESKRNYKFLEEFIKDLDYLIINIKKMK